MDGSPFNSLEHAISCFYESNNPLQSKAKSFLDQLQSSPQIWNAIWNDLLSNTQPEVQFYGATVLHNKVLIEWSTIPTEELEPLKIKLLQGIVYFKDGPKMVLSRLCIILGIFITRSICTIWPNAITDLICKFQDASLFQNVPNFNPESITCLLLEILRVIPEEFQTSMMSKNEKVLVKSALHGDSTSILPLLELHIGNPNIDVKLQALKCAKSWLEFGISPEECDNLLDILIDTTNTTYLTHEECALNSIEAIVTLCIHPNISKLPVTVTRYLKKILLLSGILSNQDALNYDFIPSLYTLYVSIGEAHLKEFMNLLITSDREVFLKLLEIILQCTNAPGCYPTDEIYSIQTFNFWYLLQDELMADEVERRDEIACSIRPYYRNLIMVLMNKSMIPKNLNEWSEADKETFRCYEQEIDDCYTYCYAVLGYDMMDLLRQFLEQEILNPNVVTDSRNLNACLKALTAISENVITMDDPHLNQCIMALQKLPLNSMNIRTCRCVMELLGAYAEWFCYYPDLIEFVLSLIFTGIMNPQLALYATVALKDISVECKTILPPYAEGISDKIMGILQSEQVKLKHDQELRLIYTLGILISRMPEEEKVLQYLNTIVGPYAVKIDTLLNSPSISLKKTEKELVFSVEVFSQLFMGMSNKPTPVFRLFQSILPKFDIIIKCCKGSRIINEICRSIKHAVNNLGDHCCDLLVTIVNIILRTYESNQNGDLFELAKMLMILFSNNKKWEELMNSMFQNICRMTFNIFGDATLENVSVHTILIEHFFIFCTSVVKKNIPILLQSNSNTLESLFRFAGYGLCAQESNTVKMASAFLSNMITISREHQPLVAVINDHGEELVYNILIAIGKISPRNCLDHLADVLLALSKKYCDCLSIWLNKYLNQINFPTNRVTHSAQKHFMTSILREKANRRKVQDLTKEFSFLCRGLLDINYFTVTPT